MDTLYAIENIPFAVQLPSGLFLDPDMNPLVITALVSPNSPLPNWLAFDTSTNILSGTPSSTDTGTLILQLQATDPFGLSSPSLYVSFYIQADNAPEIRPGQIMPNQTINSYSDFAFQIPDTLFFDPDVESVVLNIFQKNGSDVPSWIKFSPENRLVYGT